jgi:PIN domain nuclease of toxin-antitoxin system
LRILIDTHAFLWELLGDPRSSRTAIEILGDEANELVLSIASLWEIVINMRLGRLHGLGSSIAYVRQMAGEYGMEILPIRYEHLLALETLPVRREHRDPFDRLLIAQALAEGLPILTHDEKFLEYPAKTIW